MNEPFYQDQLATIYCGNALEVLKELPDESIQMVMTSPPYWGLRQYAGGADLVWGGIGDCEHEWIETTQGLEHENRNLLIGTQEQVVGQTATAFIQKYDRLPAGFCSICGAWRGQLGLEPTPDLYVEHLMMIFQEVKRVLRKDGSFYLNIGDTYVSGKGSCFNPGGGPQSWPSRVESQENYPIGRDAPNRMYKALPPKCMTCIPERVMFAMIEAGWTLRNKIIWYKPNSMPSSVKDRFTSTFEFIFFFIKSTNTILWCSRETGEWRGTRPTKEENYPWGGRYQHKDSGEFSWAKPPEGEKNNWIKHQPLWMGFDYYFDLDAVREPHTTESLERYQGVDDLFGHGPNQQSFNLRVRDVKRGKGGVFVQGGEVKALTASEQEIDDYEYPEKMPRHHGSGPQYRLTGTGRGSKKHHGSSMNNQDRLHKDRQGKNPGDVVHTPDGDFILGSEEYADWYFQQREKRDWKSEGEPVRYTKGNRKDTEQYPHPIGKNPGDYWELTTQPYKGAHFAVFPEKLCERPIKASSRVGDTILDPFGGSGTTGVVAKRLGRKVIIIDCVARYCEIAKRRIQKVAYQPELL